jgi:hypothetical protein
MITSVVSVYKLKPNLIDPRFQGCIFATNAKSLRGESYPSEDFDVANGMSIEWTPRELGSIWRPQPVNGPTHAFNDYPCLDLNTPAFSQRAVDALGSMLADNGELLPLKTKIGKYYAFNCLTKIDALDVKKSEIERPYLDEIALDVPYFVFRKSKLKDATLFRIAELPSSYFVTNLFKERVESAGLNGMNFIPVWPLPEGSDWRSDEAKRDRKSKLVQLAGQSLILRLRLRKPKPSVSEKKLASEIEESLAKKLRVLSLSAPYLGTIEISEFEDGEFRVFCTCPRCDELALYLSDWLEDVPWDYDFDIVKRYGNLYDQKAKEKRITIHKASA